MNKNPIIYILSLIYGLPVLAANEADNISGVLKASEYQMNYFSIILSLIFVILLIYITGILYTKLNKIGIKTIKKEYEESMDIKPVVISTTPIGSSQTLQVVEIAGEKLLLGVTKENVSLIKSFTSDTPSESVESEIRNFTNTNKKEDAPQTINKEKHVINEDDFGLYKKYLR